MDWHHYLEVFFWGGLGGLGVRLGQWIRQRREMRYRFKCPACTTSFRMNHNYNGVFEKMVEEHKKSHEPKTKLDFEPKAPTMSSCSYSTEPRFVNGAWIEGEPECVVHSSFSKWAPYFGAHRPCITVDP